MRQHRGRTSEPTYDVRGRMLTRKVSTDENPSTFEWDGMNMVREVDAAGNVTQYFVIRGVIRSFLRGGVTYQVHSSAQGHVRLITDASGDVVFRASYDAWGNTLSVTDSVPDGGWMYRYVGTRGCRFDPDTGLTYMRARWHSATIQRFISRDAVKRANRYAYASNLPTNRIDPSGRADFGDFGTGQVLPTYYPWASQDVADRAVAQQFVDTYMKGQNTDTSTPLPTTGGSIVTGQIGGAFSVPGYFSVSFTVGVAITSSLTPYFTGSLSPGFGAKAKCQGVSLAGSFYTSIVPLGTDVDAFASGKSESISVTGLGLTGGTTQAIVNGVPIQSVDFGIGLGLGASDSVTGSVSFEDAVQGLVNVLDAVDRATQVPPLPPGEDQTELGYPA